MEGSKRSLFDKLSTLTIEIINILKKLRVLTLKSVNFLNVTYS
jgi:hypothetical protein